MRRLPPNHRTLLRTPCLCAMVALAAVLSLRGDANGQVGTPAAQVAPVQAEQTLEPYPITDATRGVLQAWQQYAAGRQELRIALDERTSQALVFASPAVHSQIRQQITAKAAAAQQQPQLQQQPVLQVQHQPAAGSAAASGVEATPAAATVGPVLVQLRNMTAPELHPRLEKVLARPLPATVDVSGEWQSFAVEATAGASVAMHVNNRTGQVRIDGPAQQTAAWRSVLEAIDSPNSPGGKVTQLISTKPANHERVRVALQALQAGAKQASLVTTLFQQAGVQQGENASGGGGQPSAPGTQAPAQQPGATAADLQNAIDAAKLAEAAGGLLGPVQVEFVEGLDVIVLRGADRDVQRVMDIINQIEQLSAITVPAIEIHELKYLDSVQLAALLMRLYQADGILGSRGGAVSITPLGKPNALLLIGRAENVKTAIELINRIDQPVVPTSRFEVFPLQHASAAEVKTLIDSFLGQAEGQEPRQDAVTEAVEDIPTLAPRALVVADVRTNSLIVSAGVRDLAEIAALVERIDTPGASAELKVFTIVNGDATALAEMLRALFSVPADPTAATTAAEGIAQGGPVRMQFSVDPRTNSIIAVGSREDLAVVEAILLRLDEGDLRERVTRVYKLNNAFAGDVALALNEWLQSERQVEADVDLTITPFQQIEREVIIVQELATNSLIISATPRFFEDVMKVVRELDERPPMVLIQVLIAEVRLNDTDEFGVELGLQDSLLFDRSLLSDVVTQSLTNTSPNGVQTTTQNIISATGSPGYNFNNQPLGNNVFGTTALAGASKVATQGLSNFSLNRVNGDLGFGGFVFAASSNSVSVLLRALQEKRRLEVLSRPQLMALDGQPGQVQVGQNVPRIQATNIDAFGGTTNSITYERVGLILQVVPRISPDGLVVMNITAIKSEVGPEADGIPISISPQGQVLRAPRIESTEALTTVSALSGQTVVLGGLLQTRKQDVHRRVPLLADIPLLGSLFRYDSVAEERRELLIVLTPQIIYNKMDSDLVKQIESSRMSWILSDVVNLHGEAGLRSRCDAWADGEMESVYPSAVMPPEEGVLPLSPSRSLEGEGSFGVMSPYDNVGTCEPAPISSEPIPGQMQPYEFEMLPEPATGSGPTLSPSTGS